jgi:hypothetical protein
MTRISVQAYGAYPFGLIRLNQRPWREQQHPRESINGLRSRCRQLIPGWP